MAKCIICPTRFCGEGKEVTLGGQGNDVPILPIEVFQEIKKCLNTSKKKME